MNTPMRTIGSLLLFMSNAVATVAIAATVMDPRVGQITAAVVNTRSSAAMTTDAFAAAATMQVAPDNPSWGPEDPRWSRVFPKVQSELQNDPEVKDGLFALVQSASRSWNSALNQTLSSDDISTLVEFFHSNEGARDITFNRILDAIYDLVIADITQNPSIMAPGRQIPDLRSDPNQMVFDVSFSILLAQQSQPAGDAAQKTIVYQALTKHTDVLSALRTEYAGDFKAFAAFNNSPAFQKVLMAEPLAVKLAASTPFGDLRPVMDHAINRHLASWRQCYEQSSGTGAGK
jgi:hypothetical protein